MRVLLESNQILNGKSKSKEKYIKILKKFFDNFSIFKFLALQDVKSKLENQDLNDESKQKYTILLSFINSINNWEDVNEENHEYIFELSKDLFSEFVLSQMRYDHNLNYDEDSIWSILGLSHKIAEDKEWITSSEMKIYLMSFGYYFLGSVDEEILRNLGIDGGVIMHFFNSRGDIEYIYNNSSKEQRAQTSLEEDEWSLSEEGCLEDCSSKESLNSKDCASKENFVPRENYINFLLMEKSRQDLSSGTHWVSVILQEVGVSGDVTDIA